MRFLDSGRTWGGIPKEAQVTRYKGVIVDSKADASEARNPYPCSQCSSSAVSTVPLFLGSACRICRNCFENAFAISNKFSCDYCCNKSTTSFAPARICKRCLTSLINNPEHRDRCRLCKRLLSSDDQCEFCDECHRYILRYINAADPGELKPLQPVSCRVLDRFEDAFNVIVSHQFGLLPTDVTLEYGTEVISTFVCINKDVIICSARAAVSPEQLKLPPFDLASYT